MVKFIQSNDLNFLKEIQINLLNRLGEAGHEINSNGEINMLKIDFDILGEQCMKIVEIAINARIQAGVFPAELYQVDEVLIQNAFSLTADSDEKLDIILKDILRGAKVPETQYIVLEQPWGPGMYNTLTKVVIALDLTEDQMKAIQTAAKMARTGIKITNGTKKVALVAGATANVATRVGKEIALAGTEIGANIATSAVKTGVEMGAVVLNSAVRDLNPRELIAGSNVQQLMKTVKSVWGKESSKITNGFADL